MSSDHLKSFDKDSIIFREGDAPGAMYIVHAGQVRILKAIQTKYETLGVLGRGEFFGEMSIIEKLPRNATAIAVEDGTRLIAIDLDRFEKMLQDNIAIAIQMIKKYSARLREADKKLERLLSDKEELDSGIQDILSHVRKRGEETDVDNRELFGWVEHAETGQRFPLKRPEVLVGRIDPVTKQKPDLDLGALDANRTVSRRHARLSYIDERVYISEEPGVTNGTLVNDQQIAQARLVEVLNNDKIQFGNVSFRLQLELKA